MKNHCEGSLLADDVKKRYTNYRTTGKSRANAIAAIKSDFACELNDSDDCMFVWCGLVLALAKKKELIEEIAKEAEVSIVAFKAHQESDDGVGRFLLKIQQVLANEKNYGREALYGSRSQYVPDWKIGDLFSHTLTIPAAEKLGIWGWIILLYKVGEHTDEFGKVRQLMLLAVCPPDKIPASSAQLQEIGFLRTMCHNETCDYFFQIIPKNKKDEQGYEMSLIGSYPDISLPTDHAEENPMVVMPIFGRMKKDDIRPAYEDQVCRLFKRFGRTT